MPESVLVSLHHWPWSVDIPEESVLVTDDEVTFPFFGSPVLSVMKNVQVLLSARYEKFIPLGPSFLNKIDVLEMPHGVLSTSGSNKGDISLLFEGKLTNVSIETHGARNRTRDNGKQESQWARIVLSWSQFFDDLIETKIEKGEKSDRIPWDLVLDFLKQQINDLQQPRLSLIVRIAEALHTTIPKTVNGMRRILIRERSMQRINRINETDVGCLQWYVRQPGNSMAEKGGRKQELLSVVRRESFDVLENRVLKDFLYRCSSEALRYINSEVDITPIFLNTSRALDVRRFREVCLRSLKHPDLESVPKAGARIRPNYVLQNDLRYRNIWDWYCRLLRREEEEDRFWDWQGRTWADIVRMLMNLSIVNLTLEKPERAGIYVRQKLNSSLQVTQEQVLGSRTRGGSEPGPFVIERYNNGELRSVAILEIVHPDNAHQHFLTQNLSRTGGHLYFVIRSLDQRLKKDQVLIVWGVNTAGSNHAIPWEGISKSANYALDFHRTILAGERVPNIPELRGLVVANTLNYDSLSVVNEDTNAPVAIMPSDPNYWNEYLDFLALLLDDRLERLV